MTSRPSHPVFASGLSGNPDAGVAVRQACDAAAAALAGARVDLLMVFLSSHHIQHASDISASIRRQLDPRCLIGVSAASVLGGVSELEDTPGISILAASAPGLWIHSFTSRDLPAPDAPPGEMAEALGVHDDQDATIVFADPFSVPLVKMLPAMTQASPGVIVGGLASGADEPGGNVLFLDDLMLDSGLVGVSIRGPLRVDVVVSQGCRAVGPNMIVTKARANLVQQLGGRPAVTAVQEIINELDDAQRELLRNGLYLGCVRDEYRERFGQGDYLIRNVMAVDEKTGALAVGELMRVGQTVRLHVRDAQTAKDDLEMLLDAQKLHEPPIGALLLTCNSRGRALFGESHRDVKTISRAFAPLLGGEEMAKGGQAFNSDAPALPLAGFFAAGEIGPIGDTSYLHSHSACLALFRATRRRGLMSPE